MNTLESKCKKLLIILENGDVEAYKRLRTSIVADISDNDFMVGEYEDDLAVGKVLVIILDDISHGGILYKRIVLIAMRSLLKIIINDKIDSKPQTAIASALLLVLFSENQDFIGGEYIVSKVRATEAAAHQYIGMSCVFFWKYKLNATKPSLLYTSNPQPIGFSGILLAKRQNSFYCTYFLHNRNVADTKSPYPIKRLEVIRWFNQKSMVFNQSLS